MPVTDSVLHQLLEHRLLDVGEDDARFERIREAAALLTQRLAAEPVLVVPFALAAADPQTPEDAPAFSAAHEAMKEAWPTYRGRWTDAATEVWRAVLLTALVAQGHSNPDVAAAAALTLASRLPRLAPGRDATVVAGAYESLRGVAEERAAADWSEAVSAARLRVPKPKLTLDNVKPVKVDVARVTKLFAAAAGPQDRSGTALPDPNPNWPSSNQTEWAYSFAPRAAAAVTEAINTALGSVGVGSEGAVEAIAAQLGQWATHVGDLVRQSMGEVVRGAEGVRRRSALLWWRAALFSPTTGKSYRDLPAPVAVMQMAIDLHEQVPAHAPESVEHFLREVVRDLVRTSAPRERAFEAADGGSRITVRDAVNAVGDVERLVTGREARTPSAGPATLLDVLEAARHANPVPTGAGVDVLVGRLGQAGAGVLELDELAAWVFRDLQAARLVRALTETAEAEHAATATPAAVATTSAGSAA